MVFTMAFMYCCFDVVVGVVAVVVVVFAVVVVVVGFSVVVVVRFDVVVLVFSVFTDVDVIIPVSVDDDCISTVDFLVITTDAVAAPFPLTNFSAFPRLSCLSKFVTAFLMVRTSSPIRK